MTGSKGMHNKQEVYIWAIKDHSRGAPPTNAPRKTNNGFPFAEFDAQITHDKAKSQGQDLSCSFLPPSDEGGYTKGGPRKALARDLRMHHTP